MCLCLDVSISHVCLEQIDPGKRIPCFHKYVEVRTDGWIKKMFSEGKKKKRKTWKVAFLTAVVKSGG